MITPEQIQSQFPIGAIALYEGGHVASVLRYAHQTGAKSPAKQTRGRISHLSQKSLNRLNFLVQTTTINLRSMLTLTYLCPPVSGTKAKQDLKKALQWLKRRCKGEIEYVWFAEFTKAGGIHFHILLDCIPNDYDRIEFAVYWLKATQQGRGFYCDLRRHREMNVLYSILNSVSHPNTWQPLNSVDGAKRYCGKYATKTQQKEVPIWFRDIGRFWGVSRGVKENKLKHELVELTEDELKELLKDANHPAATWDVMPKYLWNVCSIDITKIRPKSG